MEFLHFLQLWGRRSHSKAEQSIEQAHKSWAKKVTLHQPTFFRWLTRREKEMKKFFSERGGGEE